MSAHNQHSTQDTSALVVRIWNALGKGRRNDELLDGRDFDPAKWEDAEAALESLLEQLEAARAGRAEAVDVAHARGYRDGVREEKARAKQGLEGDNG